MDKLTAQEVAHRELAERIETALCAGILGLEGIHADMLRSVLQSIDYREATESLMQEAMDFYSEGLDSDDV